VALYRHTGPDPKSSPERARSKALHEPEILRQRATFPAVSRRHPLLVALEPVAEALGATLVDASGVLPGDIALRWDDELVGGLRLPGVHGALERMMAAVEAELGGALAELSREDKQQAVRLLDERGAFQLRRSVEEVADALGVSRFTVYNYLNAGAERGGEP
jgi:HTH domain